MLMISRSFYFFKSSCWIFC